MTNRFRWSLCGVLVLWSCSVACITCIAGSSAFAQPVPESQSTEVVGATYPLRSDSELDAAVVHAQAEALAHHKEVLLVFGANWCPDCREVRRIMLLPSAHQALMRHYVPVYINVGRFDRHGSWLSRYHVERIATLVIVDASGVARTTSTLEPISSGVALTASAMAHWLNHPE